VVERVPRRPAAHLTVLAPGGMLARQSVTAEYERLASTCSMGSSRLGFLQNVICRCDVETRRYGASAVRGVRDRLSWLTAHSRRCDHGGLDEPSCMLGASSAGRGRSRRL
jgi:hypothetical protein